MSTTWSIEKNLVWLLKSAEEDDPYLVAIQQSGFACCLIPVLDFAFCNLSELSKSFQDPHSYSGLVLTSPRCVEAVELSGGLKAFKEQKAWAEKPIYTVGPATANATKEKLGLESRGKEAGNAKKLAELIIEDSKKKKRQMSPPLLFPCSSIRRDVLPQLLKDADIALASKEVYVTGPHPKLKDLIQKALKTQGFPEFCVFFSPSGVRYFSSAISNMHLPTQEMKMVALGPTTAESIKHQEWNLVAVAEKQSPEYVANALSST